MVTLGTVKKPFASTCETYLGGLKVKHYLNNVAFRSNWVVYLFDDFIPLRSMFLLLAFDCDAENYKKLVWKTQPLFIHSLRDIPTDTTLKPDEQLDIKEFQHKQMTFYLRRNKNILREMIINAMKFRKLMVTATNEAGESNIVMGHSYRTAMENYDMDRHGQTLKSVDNRYKALEKAGVASHPGDQVPTSIDVADLNAEHEVLRKEQAEIEQRIRKEATTIQTNLRRSDHVQLEIISRCLCLMYPAYTRDLMNWRQFAQKNQLSKKITSFVLIPQCSTLREVTKNTIIQFREIDTKPEKLESSINKQIGNMGKVLLKKTDMFTHVSVVLFFKF